MVKPKNLTCTTRGHELKGLMMEGREVSSQKAKEGNIGTTVKA